MASNLSARIFLRQMLEVLKRFKVPCQSRRCETLGAVTVSEFLVSVLKNVISCVTTENIDICLKDNLWIIL